MEIAFLAAKDVDHPFTVTGVMSFYLSVFSVDSNLLAFLDEFASHTLFIGASVGSRFLFF